MNFRELEKVPAHQTSHPRTNRKKMANFTLSAPTHLEHTGSVSAHQHIFRAHHTLNIL